MQKMWCKTRYKEEPWLINNKVLSRAELNGGTSVIRDGGGEAAVRLRASQEKDRSFPKFSELLSTFILLNTFLLKFNLKVCYLLKSC